MGDLSALEADLGLGKIKEKKNNKQAIRRRVKKDKPRKTVCGFFAKKWIKIR